MRLFDRIFTRAQPPAISMTDWNRQFKPGAQVSYQGNTYQAYRVNDGGAIAGVSYYETNSVVFACEQNRIQLFSEARFQFQQFNKGRPGDLFGTQDLLRLEEPWPGHTTSDLLVQAELDILHAGNSYWVNDRAGLLRLDPSKIRIVTEAANDEVIYGQRIGLRLSGYLYMEDKDNVTFYLPEDVCHYKPYPDRCNRFLGMSWLSPCLPDVDSDTQFTAHKESATGNGAQLGYVVSLDKDISSQQFKDFVEDYRLNHEGAQNAGKTLFLGGGADVKTVSQTFQTLEPRATQGAGETRIAACAQVPPVIVGLSEGLDAATYSNYSQARRRFADGTMRPLWRSFAGAMQSLCPPPAGARLWYDDRDIPFLREDRQDAAVIQQTKAATIKMLVDAGYTAETVVKAVEAEDMTLLTHSGLFSVQLQSPGSPKFPEGVQAALPEGTANSASAAKSAPAVGVNLKPGTAKPVPSSNGAKTN